MSIDWLRARAPGFQNLSLEEVGAISDFSLLWSLFEARILDRSASAGAICAKVESWRAAGTLAEESYDPQLSYFRQRYFAGGQFTHHFPGLLLRQNDQEALVRGVLSGVDNAPDACVSTVFIIVYRYRNNLFHGAKWQYEIAGQLENFQHANAALTMALDQHGGLG